MKIWKLKYKKLKKKIVQLKQENEKIKQESEQTRNLIEFKQENFVETSNNQNIGIIILDKQTPTEIFIH